MAGVQFFRPIDHSQLKKSAQETRPDELSFSLRKIFWNPIQSQVKVDTRILQNRSFSVIFVQQLRCKTGWETRPQILQRYFSRLKSSAEPRKLNPNRISSSCFRTSRTQKAFRAWVLPLRPNMYKHFTNTKLYAQRRTTVTQTEVDQEVLND